MRVGDLAQALAPGALLENSNPVDIERSPADVNSLTSLFDDIDNL